MSRRPTHGNENRRRCHPRASGGLDRPTRKVDSRFRGNDHRWVIYAGAVRLARAGTRQPIVNVAFPRSRVVPESLAANDTIPDPPGSDPEARRRGTGQSLCS